MKKKKIIFFFPFFFQLMILFLIILLLPQKLLNYSSCDVGFVGSSFFLSSSRKGSITLIQSFSEDASSAAI